MSDEPEEPDCLQVVEKLKACTTRDVDLDVCATIAYYRKQGWMYMHLKENNPSKYGMFYHEYGPYDERGDPEGCGLSVARDCTSTQEKRDEAITLLLEPPWTEEQRKQEEHRRADMAY